MTGEETARFSRELSRVNYRGWKFYLDDPEPFFFFSNPKTDVTVYCSPDWGEDDTIDIQVNAGDGTITDSINAPFLVRTSQRILEAVRPWLDKYMP